MSMLRNLLTDGFKLTFHREEKMFSIYELQVAKNGPKLKASAAPPDDPPALISTVYPQRIVMPARNVTMSDLARLMQRAILDRPVVDKTGLTRRYDFDRPRLFFGDSATAGSAVVGDQGAGPGACRR
jgi:uncharacterized protein (TIGR03435 family)